MKGNKAEAAENQVKTEGKRKSPLEVDSGASSAVESNTTAPGSTTPGIPKDKEENKGTGCSVQLFGLPRNASPHVTN